MRVRTEMILMMKIQILQRCIRFMAYPPTMPRRKEHERTSSRIGRPIQPTEHPASLTSTKKNTLCET